MDRGVFQVRENSERSSFSDITMRFKEDFAPFHYRKREDGKEAWRTQVEHLRRELGKYSIPALTAIVVAQYRDKRLKSVGSSTVKKELDMLSKILTIASKEFGIVLPNGNPVANVRKPKDAPSRTRRLVGKEEELLIKECTASRNQWLLPAVQLAIETAMRQGEILSLEKRNIDYKRKLALLLDPGKIKNGEARAVPLTSKAIAILKELPKTKEIVAFPVQRITLFHAFSAACKRAKIKDLTFHDLRHEAISRLAERGDLSVLELSAISGHKTLQMLKRYTHLQAETLANKLG
jgi:integrase